MKLLAFFNIKGGVGKTTSAINVAYNLAALHNKKVLLIDVDPQGNASFFFGCEQNEYILEDLLRGFKVKPDKNKEHITAKKVIVKTKYNNLDFIPTRNSLWTFEKELLLSDGKQQFKLRDALRPVADDYDFIIIDCTNVVGSLINLNVFAIADYVFVPMKDEAWAIQGLELTKQVLNEMYDYNTKLKLGGCFYCGWENRKVSLTSFMHTENQKDNKLIKVKIRKNKSIPEMSYVREPLLIYDKKGKATQDYIDLTNEILKIVTG